MSSDWLLEWKITDEITVKTQIHMLTFQRMDSIDDECKNSNINTYIRVMKQSPPELNFMYAGVKEWIYGYVSLWYLKRSCGLGILGIYYTFIMHVTKEDYLISPNVKYYKLIVFISFSCHNTLILSYQI